MALSPSNSSTLEQLALKGLIFRHSGTLALKGSTPTLVSRAATIQLVHNALKCADLNVKLRIFSRESPKLPFWIGATMLLKPVAIG